MKLQLTLAGLMLMTFSMNTIGQQQNWLIPPPSQINTELMVDAEAIRNSFKEEIPEKYYQSGYEREVHLYADNVSYSIARSLASGRVQTNWPEMQEYITAIIKEVVPAEVLEELTIRPYIYKEAGFNASMHASGVMLVNIGMWPHLESEAQLAAVLAHEVAHYMLHHSLQTYIAHERGDFDWGLAYSDKKVKELSQHHEMEADSVAHRWVADSRYSIEGSVSMVRLLERLEAGAVKRHPDKWELEATSHPLSADRVAAVLGYRSQDSEGSSLFVQDEALFHALRKQAIYENLETRLRDFEYVSGMEDAFKAHLASPDDPILIYYLMESIRRGCYRNSDLWGKYFFTWRYYEDRQGDAKSTKTPVERHLFERFDPSIMGMSPGQMRNIQARFYWDGDLKFRTHEEAFLFFYRLGEALGCHECQLSEALSQVNDKEARNAALDKYLSADGVFTDFAQALKKDEIHKDLSKNKSTFFENLSGYIRQGQDPIPVNIDGSIGRFMEMIARLDQRFEDRDIECLQTIREQNLADYLLLKELKTLSTMSFVSKGVKPELYIIDPRYAGLFERFDVEEIEFVSTRFNEFRKPEKGVVSYADALGMNMDHVLDATECTRFLEMYLSSVRSIEEGRMMYQYYSDEVKMKFKEAGEAQMENMLSSQLKAKDDKMTKDHYYYRTLD